MFIWIVLECWSIRLVLGQRVCGSAGIGYYNNNTVRASGGRGSAGRRPQAAFNNQRGVVCGRTGVETVPRGGDIPGCGEQVLRGWRDRDVCLSVVLLSHSRFQTTRILHHQYLRRHGKSGSFLYPLQKG